MLALMVTLIDQAKQSRSSVSTLCRAMTSIGAHCQRRVGADAADPGDQLLDEPATPRWSLAEPLHIQACNTSQVSAHAAADGSRH
jgi:hypothetical protein